MIKALQERINLNMILGAMMLIALFSVAGDAVIGNILAQIPGQVVSEATPCRWLQTAPDLAQNQSLIGRASLTRTEPLELTVRASGLPTQPGEILRVRIIITNNSLGTIPFIYNPEEVIVGDNNTSGLGIIFNPANNIFVPGAATRADAATYPTEDIRILGPQQRCAHTLEFTFEQLSGSLTGGNVSVLAYYRGNNAGIVPQVAPPNPTPIYPDQGLPRGGQGLPTGGLITSEPVALQ